MRRVGRSRWVLSGMVPLSDLSEITGVEFEGVSSNTLNGLFCELLERLPKVDDEVEFGNLKLTALKVSRTRVVEADARVTRKKTGGEG